MSPSDTTRRLRFQILTQTIKVVCVEIHAVRYAYLVYVYVIFVNYSNEKAGNLVEFRYYRPSSFDNLHAITVVLCCLDLVVNVKFDGCHVHVFLYLYILSTTNLVRDFSSLFDTSLRTKRLHKLSKVSQFC